MLDNIHTVAISVTALKQLQIVPVHIAGKLYTWIKQVRLLGLSETRKIKGYYDEPLKGDRDHQRSIRLNKAYRAIYVIKKGKTIKFAEIKEVNKHDY